MKNSFRKMKPIALGAAGLAALSACAPNNPEDPLEPMNRVVHQFNIVADKVVLRPASKALDAVTNEDVQQSIANVGDNLNEPINAANHVLQGDFVPAFKNVSRFALNTTYGVAGLTDAASYMGLMPDPTNFGQTLAKWGVPEGPYVELPLFGPNTARSATGLVVDLVYNPLTYNLTGEELWNYRYFQLFEKINQRAMYGNLLDMLLYQSPDSYLATRLAYLQNQRAATEETTGAADSGTVELENFYE